MPCRSWVSFVGSSGIHTSLMLSVRQEAQLHVYTCIFGNERIHRQKPQLPHRPHSDYWSQACERWSSRHLATNSPATTGGEWAPIVPSDCTSRLYIGDVEPQADATDWAWRLEACSERRRTRGLQLRRVPPGAGDAPAAAAATEAREVLRARQRWQRRVVVVQLVRPAALGCAP